MEVRAIAKSVRISPRKTRLVADAIRNLSIDEAFQVLWVTRKRAARSIAKALESAVANAENNAKLDKKNLMIGSIMISEGQALKRFHPSSRGRVHPYKKRSSNIRIILKEKLTAISSVTSEVAKVKAKAANTVTEQGEVKK